MKCSKIQDNFSSYYDDLLEAESKEEVLRHLAECEACSKDYEAFRNAVASLNALQEVEAPGDIYVEVNRRIDRLKSRKSFLERFFANPIVTAVPQLASILIMFVLGGTLFYAYRTFTKLPDRPARQVAKINVGSLSTSPQAGPDATQSRMIEVVPCARRSRALDRRIQNLVVLSNGQILNSPPGNVDEHGEILIRVPKTSYVNFINSLRKTIDDERDDIRNITGQESDSLDNFQEIEERKDVAPKTQVLSEPTPIPEVKLIKVVF